jgi:hypothetical protein
MIDIIKISIITLLGALITYLKPIYNPVVVLIIAFVVDICAGVLVDLIRNDDRIRLKKFLISMAFLTLYSGIIAFTYIIGERMNDTPEALYIVKTLTYTFIVFYVSNIFRNLNLLIPNNKPVAFLNYFFGLHIIKKMPELAKFLGLKK